MQSLQGQLPVGAARDGGGRADSECAAASCDMPGGLNCPRCAGLLVPEADDPAYAKCVACARSWTPAQVAQPRAVAAHSEPLVVPEQRQEEPTMGKWSEATRAAFTEKLRAARARKRGTTVQADDESEPSEATVPVQTCGVAGCKKPRRADSTQCERHYQKSLRNNIKYREKTKKALNGSGTDWKSQALSALVSQRETLTAKIHEIDTVMAAIQGM